MTKNTTVVGNPSVMVRVTSDEVMVVGPVTNFDTAERVDVTTAEESWLVVT